MKKLFIKVVSIVAIIVGVGLTIFSILIPTTIV